MMDSERIQRQIDLFLDEAEAALTQFDWEKVSQRAQAVLAIGPHNDDGLTFLLVAVPAAKPLSYHWSMHRSRPPRGTPKERRTRDTDCRSSQ